MIKLAELIERSVNNMGAVEDRVAEKAAQLISIAYMEGIFVQISSGYRSLEEQARLYGKGRPSYRWNGKNYGRSGSIVTYAKPGESIHNKGRAIDFFLVTKDGQTALWKVDKNWHRVGAIGKSLGFTWGGDWKSFKDYPHLELAHDSSSSAVLKRGDRGEEVKNLQRQLSELGYSLGGYGVDGSFGKITDSAVRAFQKNAGIKVDGIAGPITRKKLDESVYPGTPLRAGATGEAVKRIQKVIGVKTDGLFGQKTEAAVRSFQMNSGIEVDGVVGPITWRYLFS
ncbi:peptidoglycan-binding protein [Halobacillus mangrovi]|uniref:peptidoglycan-binding protein n=1 Tax=Halobacillus mangrovi TaxID=402384 RepID=UPI003D97B2AC